MAAGLAALNVQPGFVNTRFYPFAPDASVDVSSGNVPTQSQQQYEATLGGASNGLPVMWWLGILIVLVALRLAYEFM
jgi:hypothetical protein